VQAAIDNVATATHGRIGLSACPGIASAAPGGGRGALDADLAAIAGWGAGTLVTLVESFELTLLGVADLGERARAHALAWWHLPIVDGAAPGSPFERAWHETGPALHAALDAGGRIVVHCHAGLGRSGEVAARLLVERGMSADDAMAAVRRARPGAIQTPEQVQWVRQRGAR
jgi:ADP-ribosyl-[dinitrogen reductase] hydrolase